MLGQHDGQNTDKWVKTQGKWSKPSGQKTGQKTAEWSEIAAQKKISPIFLLESLDCRGSREIAEVQTKSHRSRLRRSSRGNKAVMDFHAIIAVIHRRMIFCGTQTRH
jgi:hypothetical protein